MKNNDEQTSIPRVYLNPDSVSYVLASMPYRERRLFFSNNIRPKYPRFQYKYMSISSDGNDRRVGYLRDFLVESKLWLSSPLDFNDPFDMSAKVIFEGDTKEIRGRFKELIDERALGSNWKKRRKLLDGFMTRGREAWFSSINRIFLERQKRTGIFSFAGDPRSILMWSHYANNHTGVDEQADKITRVMVEHLCDQYAPNDSYLKCSADMGYPYLSLLNGSIEASKKDPNYSR